MNEGVKLILYSYARSSCSWRVRSALHYKQLPFETRSVFIYGGEQNGPEYRRLNPGQMVPALVVVEEGDNNNNSKTLFESLAIIDYLEQRFPNPIQPPLVPFGGNSANSISKRTNVLAISQTIVSGIQPLQNMAVMQYATSFASSKESETLKSKQAEKALAWSRHWITTKFSRLETLLEPLSDGQFTVGNQLTLADLCLVPQVYNAVHYGVDVTRFPLINRLYKRLLEEEECIHLGRPEVQPDWDPQKERDASGF